MSAVLPMCRKCHPDWGKLAGHKGRCARLSAEQMRQRDNKVHVRSFFLLTFYFLRLFDFFSTLLLLERLFLLSRVVHARCAILFPSVIYFIIIIVYYCYFLCVFRLFIFLFLFTLC